MATSLNEQFWLDEKVHELGPVGIGVWSAILQGPHANQNLPGLFYLPFGLLLDQMGGAELMGPHLVREVENAFGLILDKGMAIYDASSKVLRLPNVWKHAYAPNPNQVIGWRANWLKVADKQIRYDHLPTMRRLAQRAENPESVRAFDARFGGIVPFDQRTYRLGNQWKPGGELPSGIRLWVDGPLLAPAPDTNRNDLFLSKRSEENSHSHSHSAFSNPSRTLPEGLSKGSRRVPPEADDVNESDADREGFEMPSGRVPRPERNRGRSEPCRPTSRPNIPS